MRTVALVTLMLLALSAIPVVAHDEVRVIGIVTKRQTASIDVKTKEGKTFTITLGKSTPISRDKKKVAASELKAGITVVVDALGDSDADLEAQEVRIVPAITGK